MSGDSCPLTGLAAANAEEQLRKVTLVEDGSFPIVRNAVSVNLAPSKEDAGQGKGPIPLVGSGLMEEMRTLLSGR